jgi:hypothetical protein
MLRGIAEFLRAGEVWLNGMNKACMPAGASTWASPGFGLVVLALDSVAKAICSAFAMNGPAIMIAAAGAIVFAAGVGLKKLEYDTVPEILWGVGALTCTLGIWNIVQRALDVATVHEARLVLANASGPLQVQKDYAFHLNPAVWHSLSNPYSGLRPRGSLSAVYSTAHISWDYIQALALRPGTYIRCLSQLEAYWTLLIQPTNAYALRLLGKQLM